MHFKAGLKKEPSNASNQKQIKVVAFLFSREVQWNFARYIVVGDQTNKSKVSM